MAAAAFLFLAPFPSSAGSRVAALLLALAALAWGAFGGARALGLARLPRAVAVPGLAWIGLCVASLAWSDDAAYTRLELQREVAYGAIAFIVFFAGTRTPRDAHVAIGALLAGTLVLGLFEWVRQLAPGLPYADKYLAIEGYFSTHLVIVAPLLVLVAWPGPSGMGAGRATLAALAVGLLAGGLASENRMLWIALGAATIAGFAAFRRAAGSLQARVGARPAFLLALAVITLLIAASWEYKVLRYYPGAEGVMESLSLDERPLIWESARAPLLERAWAGHGFGREIAGDAIARGLEARGSPDRFRHAHNVFLDIVLQLGLLGLAVFAALAGALALAFARAVRTPGSEPIGIAGIALLAGFLTKNLTDDFLHRPNSLVFWAVAGMLLGLAASRRA